MVGSGSRRDDGPVGLSSSNVFAALDSLRKKKKSDSSKSQPQLPKPQVFWAPTPLTVKSWADVQDDDDDDYFATTVPTLHGWEESEEQKNPYSVSVEETESEEEGLDEEHSDSEEDGDQEAEKRLPEPIREPPPPLTSKDTERQLSKKELKKKELAELDAVLAELGIAPPKLDEEKKVETYGHGDEQTPGALEVKAARKKKKKEKEKEMEKHSGEDVSEMTEVDVKEKLKKMALAKKKKQGKEMDGGAKAAALEAAARSAKLAAAKKREKNHYNQQPVR